MSATEHETLVRLVNLIIKASPTFGYLSFHDISHHLNEKDLADYYREQSFIHQSLVKEHWAQVHSYGIELTTEGIAKKEELELDEQKPLYDEQDKALIVAYMKNYIDPNGNINNGYINTGYACLEAVKGKKFKNNKHRDAFFESISAIMVNTGQYTREVNRDSDKGYNILLNPTHFHNESIKSGNRLTRKIATFAVIVSLASLLKDVIILYAKKPPQEYITINLPPQKPSTSQENLHISVQMTDSSNQKKKK